MTIRRNPRFDLSRARLTPNRLVQFDREFYVEQAEGIITRITRDIGKMLEEGTLEYDQPLGALVEEGYELDLYDGPRVKVVVQNPCTYSGEDKFGSGKYEPFFVSGSYSHRRQEVEVRASSCRPAADWVDPEFHESRLRDFLDIYLHEQTHAYDLGVHRQVLPYLGRSSEDDLRTTGDRSASEYVNLPVEVKGFGRNVYEEATRQLEFIVTGGRGKVEPEIKARIQEHYQRKYGSTPARLLEQVITGTTTWKSLSRIGLTPENHRRILRDVYQQLDADGWVQRLEEMLRG